MGQVRVIRTLEYLFPDQATAEKHEISAGVPWNGIHRYGVPGREITIRSSVIRYEVKGTIGEWVPQEPSTPVSAGG